MSDPLLVLKAVAVAFCASALAGATGRWLAKGRAVGWAWSLAIAAGVYLGLAVLGIRPRWPMREDQHRLLGLVLPAVLLFEAVEPRARRWLAMLGRAALSLAVAPVVLYGTVYVADLTGPGSAEWSPALRWLIFAGLGLASFGVWSCLDRGRQADFGARSLALAIALGGAGLTVMLSGYASGGLVGLVLAGATAGASVVAGDASPGVGVGVVGLFGVICVGHFFGRLRADAAILLPLSPLSVAIVDAFPPLRSRRRWWTAAGLALVCGVAGLVVVVAAIRFATVASGR